MFLWKPRASMPWIVTPCSLLEDWLGKLGEALLRIAPRSSAENCLRPEPGRTLELTPGRRVAVDRGLVRLDLLSGSGLLNGTLSCESGSVVLVPGLCLEAATDAKWRAHESAGTEVLKAAVRLTARLLMEALDVRTNIVSPASRPASMPGWPRTIESPLLPSGLLRGLQAGKPRPRHNRPMIRTLRWHALLRRHSGSSSGPCAPPYAVTMPPANSPRPMDSDAEVWRSAGNGGRTTTVL